MFAKTRLRIPKVDSFQLSGFTLQDARTIDPNQYTSSQLAPIREAWQALQSFVSKERPGTLTCTADTSVESRYRIAFDLWRSTNPEGTTDDFDLVYQPEYDDTDLDPRLGALSLVMSVLNPESFVGVFHLYNIRVLSDTARKLSISAYASPSFTTSRGFIDPDVVGPLMKGLLETDVFFLGSSRVLDLEEWRFPTRESHAWSSREGDRNQRILDYLSVHDRINKTVDVESVPSCIKRRRDF